MNDIGHAANEHLSKLQVELAKSHAARSVHIFNNSLVLFVAALITLASMLTLIAQPKPSYGAFTIAVGAVQTLILILIILGLILHGMSLGRLTSVLIGVLKTSMGLLASELANLPGTPGSHGSKTNQPMEGADRRGISQATRHAIATAQVDGIMNELRAAEGAIRAQSGSIDMAVFSYGFAAISLLSTSVLWVGSTENAEFLRALLIGIGTACAIAAYVVLARPTGPQFLIEQTLRKLGLSVEALTDSLRARGGSLPPVLVDQQILESVTVSKGREGDDG